jgi:hypothetical protein
MEFGNVTTVNYEDGVVYCSVSPIRFEAEYTNVAVLKSHSGFIQVPSQGDRVAMKKLKDGSRFISHVLSRERFTPDSMNEGELAIKLDEKTVLSFDKQADGTHDVTIGSSGDMALKSGGKLTMKSAGNLEMTSEKSVLINGINFEEHTHDYDDTTISDTGNGSGTASDTTETTTSPNG